MLLVNQRGYSCLDRLDLLRHGFVKNHSFFAPLFGEEQFPFGLYANGSQLVQIESQLQPGRLPGAGRFFNLSDNQLLLAAADQVEAEVAKANLLFFPPVRLLINQPAQRKVDVILIGADLP